MFANLPARDGELKSFFGVADTRLGIQAQQEMLFNDGAWFDFEKADLFRVYGRDWLNAWRRAVAIRIKSWNFNTLGAWSDETLAVTNPGNHTLKSR
jgi:hypothetical protein